MAAPRLVKAHELCLEMRNLESSLASMNDSEDRTSKNKLKLSIGKLRKQILGLDVLDVISEEEPCLEVIVSKCYEVHVRVVDLQGKIDVYLGKVANEGDEEAFDKVQATLDKFDATVKPLIELAEKSKVLTLNLIFIFDCYVFETMI